MVMIMVNIHDLKARLSEYLEQVQDGERVVICKRNQPVAELVPIAQKRTAPRPIGGGPHRFDVPESFFEPMPDEFLDAFERGDVYPAATSQVSRAAETSRPYASRPGSKRR
jgi:prevent-host-death family protein